MLFTTLSRMASGDRRKGRPLREDPEFQKLMQETGEEIAAEQELERKKLEKKKTSVRKPETGEGEQIEVIDVDEENKKKRRARRWQPRQLKKLVGCKKRD